MRNPVRIWADGDNAYSISLFGVTELLTGMGERDGESTAKRKKLEVERRLREYVEKSKKAGSR